ncbi:MAG: ABC transporter permease [Chloroflexi bacterium]|nr:ABC transporter permease [Chloroflexota bacterium]MBV9895415.1 ABC transporter permease [Chloroflexota bacterium]
MLQGALRRALAFFKANRLFTAGVLLLLVLYLFGMIGLQFAVPKGADMGAVPLNLAPSSQHPLGTDGLGRDMFTVMVTGIPNMFKIGFLAGAVGVLIGALIGLFAGYYRGIADAIFSSFADVMLVIPALAILITVSAYVRVVTVELMAIIVGLLSWPLSARVIRAQTLSLRERLFVQVAKLSGQNDFEIITLQILPNLTAYLAASFVGAVSGGILASVGLEVLGLGPQNVPTIGRTLFYAFKYAALFKGMWWWWGPPVVTLAVIFTGLFWISLSLDKYANPRLKGSARG